MNIESRVRSQISEKAGKREVRVRPEAGKERKGEMGKERNWESREK